jgi:hypothetical protein
MVVDTNLTSKSSRSVIRQLDYEVEIQPDGSLQSDLTINYDFPLEMALLDPAVGPIHGTLEYNNLFQVFAPVDTELVTVDHLQWDLEIIADDKQTDFITFATIPYDGSEHFHFSYDTPPLVEEFGPYHRYRLLLQKQAGRMEDAVHVQVTLPPGAEVVSISPRLSDQDQPAVPVVEFDMLLNTDQWVEIIYTVNG